MLKRRASRRHMDSILDPATVAILVANVDRPEAPDYIGPNSFAEISVAFSARRKVFLLQSMPRWYAEELTAWDVACLGLKVPPAASDIDPSILAAAIQEVRAYSMDCAMAAVI